MNRAQKVLENLSEINPANVSEKKTKLSDKTKKMLSSMGIKDLIGSEQSGSVFVKTGKESLSSTQLKTIMKDSSFAGIYADGGKIEIGFDV